MKDAGSSASQQEALEELFDEFLLGLEDSGADDFESFVSAHPEHAEGLRELYDGWSRLDAQVESALPEPVEELLATASRSVRDMGRPESPEWLALEEGQTLADFRLVRRIGRGGMGEVWEAHQISLDRPVALKLIRPGRSSEASARQALREARAGGRPDHPGLVAIYAAGTSDGVDYIAQQLVGDGFSLADLIARMRETPRRTVDDYRELARLFVDIADAMHAAHLAGILHRDLKPQNILIGPDDRPRVTDFGLAHSANEALDAARPGLVGTYAYMSPEQAGGKDIEIDARSDVFSLGAVFYEALTLRRAFEGDTGPQILERVIEAEPPDPRSIRSQIPHELAVICLKALTKSRSNRYASMIDFSADLRRFLANEPILARPPGVLVRAYKWAQRHPARSTALALVTMALVAISLMFVREVDLRRAADLQASIAAANERLADLRTREVVSQSYLANIRAAALHLDRGRHAAARQQLALCLAELRGWEWRHDALRADTSLLRLPHDAPLGAVAASADGDLLATGDREGRVRVYAGDGRPLDDVVRSGVPVRALALSDDGSVVAAGFEDGVATVWDRRAGTTTELAGHLGPIVAIAVSADGRDVVTGSEDDTIRLWDGREDWRSHVEPVSNGGVVSVAMTADGDRVAVGSRYGPIFVWDTRVPEVVLKRLSYKLADVHVALSGDGTRIVSAAAEGQMHVYDGATGALLWTLPEQRGAVSALAVSGDGRLIAAAVPEDNAVRLFSGVGGAPLATLTGHDRLVTSLSVSRDGRRIVAGSSDGTALVWDGATRDAVVALPGISGRLAALAASDDGALVVGASVRDLAVWDGTTGALLEVIEDAHRLVVTSTDVSGDGRRFASAGYDGMVTLWDAARRMHERLLPGHGAAVTSVALDQDGGIVVSGSHDRTVRVWDGATGDGLAVLAGPAVVTSVALDAAGERVVVGDQEGRVLSWTWRDGPDATCVLREGQGRDGTVALSRDGRRAAWAAVDEDVVEIWDAVTSEPLVTLSGYDAGFGGVSLGPDGRRVVTASSRDDVLRLWDGDSGQLLALLAGPDAPVTAVLMTGDGTRILAGAADGGVSLWESDRAAAVDLWRAFARQP